MAQLTIEQALAMAMQHHQAGQLQQAEGIYRQVLAVQSNQPDALHLLGLIEHQRGRLGTAEDLIGRAIRINPGSAQFYYNHAQVLFAMGRGDEAVEAYRRALVLHPEFPQALNNLGNLLAQRNRIDEAIDCFRRALALTPGAPETCSNLANLLQKKGQTDEALSLLRHAISVRPDLAEAHNNLGVLLRDLGQVDDAIRAFKQALALQPNYAEAYMNLGDSFLQTGQINEAIAAERQAILLHPNYAQAYNNLGTALHAAGRVDEAIAALQNALSLLPNSAEAHNNLGIISLQEQGRLDDAVGHFHRAIELRPDWPSPKYHLGLTHLLRGEFPQGWELYEHRWQVKEHAGYRRDFAQPRWDGASLDGRRILLHVEQGFGDAIQFVRYAPLVSQRGGKIILECQPELLELFRSMDGINEVIARGDRLPNFDVHCPLLSLPLVFDTTPQTIPAAVPYLHANRDLSERWRTRMEGKCFKIGLAWAGLRDHKNDRNRSMPPHTLDPLSQISDVSFFSLQKRDAIQSNDAPSIEMSDWTNELHSFADTAAFIDNLDLVITVDTAVAHLAGAMGKPVWLLLPFMPDWRWMLDRNDSPWYPTLRLFRQPRPGDWDAVIREVVQALQLHRINSQ